MSDPRIKLFGRTIQLPDVKSEDGETDRNRCFDAKRDESEEEQRVKENYSELNEDQEGLKDNHLTNPLKEDSDVAYTESNDGQVGARTEDQQEVGVSHEKGLRKPDRFLPCPRCNSVDTKFCYFNNYNTNQPRHFCKNCQRYWTAGGTMRNVPVGAGRRKNKNAVGQFRHGSVPEALQTVSVDPSTGLQHIGFSTNGTPLKFTPDAALCESTMSCLKIGESKSLSNGLNRTGEHEICVSSGSKDGGVDNSTESVVASPKNSHEQSLNPLPFAPQMPCFPGASWPYPCHFVQWNSPASAPSFAYASFPMPCYSTAPPIAGSIPGLWTVPWIISPTANTLHSQMPHCSSPSSPTLGKHSRDDKVVKSVNSQESLKENSSERILWIPKTSRVDDSGDVSILSKLGIKKDGADTVGTRSSSPFKSFKSQHKNKEDLDVKTSSVLEANPAALSRSLSFHERS